MYLPSLSIDKRRLGQGDLIKKSERIVDVLQQAHRYYADAEHYTHFVVITQSCDLVKRPQVKAPYITIAAVQPFSIVLESEIRPRGKKVPNSDFQYFSRSDRARVRDRLGKHMNNNNPEYFFFPRSPEHGIHEDLLAFLRLSVALRKSHYDELADAKVAEIKDVFQAKLGWLTGQIYSRVGTPDFVEYSSGEIGRLDDYFDQYVPQLELLYLSGMQAKELRAKVSEQAKAVGRDLTSDEVLAVLKNFPQSIEIFANEIVNRLVSSRIVTLTAEERKRAVASLAGFAELRTLVERE